MVLVGIAGPAGAGKNSVADILAKNFGFELVAFADALKQSVVALDPLVEADGLERLSDVVEREGMDEAKYRYPSVRKILQDYGVSMREAVDKDIWVKMVHQKIESSRNPNICITDLRFENELEYIMAVNGAIIRVERPVNPFDIGSGHVSEQMRVETPYVIVNDVESLDSLEAKVVSLWNDWDFNHGYQKRYIANGRALCKSCDNWKEVSQFPADNRMACGILSTCRECGNLKAKTKPSRSPQSRREEYAKVNKDLLFNKSREKLLASYGLTIQQYDAMLERQGGVCALCHCPEVRTHHQSGRKFNLAVDHDHETGRVRGLLCTKCNKAVGALGDSHESIRRVVDYLKRSLSCE